MLSPDNDFWIDLFIKEAAPCNLFDIALKALRYDSRVTFRCFHKINVHLLGYFCNLGSQTGRCSNDKNFLGSFDFEIASMQRL